MSHRKSGGDESPKVHLLLLRQKMQAQKRQSTQASYTPRSEGNAILEEEEDNWHLANTHPGTIGDSKRLATDSFVGKGVLGSVGKGGGYASMFQKGRQRSHKQPAPLEQDIRATFSKSLTLKVASRGMSEPAIEDIIEPPASETPRRRRYVSIYNKKKAAGGGGGGVTGVPPITQVPSEPILSSSTQSTGRQRSAFTAKSVQSVKSDYSIRSSQSDSALVFGRGKAGRHRRLQTAEMVEGDVVPIQDPMGALSEALEELTYSTTSDDWQIKCEGLSKVRRLVTYHPEVVMSDLQTIIERIEEAVKSPRTGVARLAMKTLEDIAVHLQSPLIFPMLDTLLKRASETNEFISSQARSVLEKLSESSDGYALLRALEKSSKLKHPGMRQQCSNMMLNTIRAANGAFPLVRTMRDAESLAEVLLGFMEDGNSLVRTAGKDAVKLVSHMTTQDAKSLIRELLKQCPVRLKTTLNALLEVNPEEADALMMSSPARIGSVSPQSTARTHKNVSPSPKQRTRQSMLPADMRQRSPLVRA